MISIKSVASRGWITVLFSVLLFIISVVLMAKGFRFGSDLLNVTGAILPIGVYEVIRGRTKYRNMSLKEYKEKFKENKEGKIYTVLAFMGAILGGAMSGYIGGEFNV